MASAKRYTPEQIEEICKLYREGKSIRLVAAKLGLSYGGVRHRLTVQEIPLRARKEAARLMSERARAEKAKKLRKA